MVKDIEILKQYLSRYIRRCRYDNLFLTYFLSSCLQVIEYIEEENVNLKNENKKLKNDIEVCKEVEKENQHLKERLKEYVEDEGDISLIAQC